MEKQLQYVDHQFEVISCHKQSKAKTDGQKETFHI